MSIIETFRANLRHAIFNRQQVSVGGGHYSRDELVQIDAELAALLTIKDAALPIARSLRARITDDNAMTAQAVMTRRLCIALGLDPHEDLPDVDKRANACAVACEGIPTEQLEAMNAIEAGGLSSAYDAASAIVEGVGFERLEDDDEMADLSYDLLCSVIADANEPARKACAWAREGLA